MTRLVAIVIPDEFQPGRWLVCRRAHGGWATAVSSHLTESSADSERKTLQRQYDLGQHEPLPEGALRQIPLGFYTDEDAA